MAVAAILFFASTVVLAIQPVEPPGPPRDFAVQINGSHVTLRWHEPAAGGPVAYYVIQVGSVPGGADLGVFNVGGLTAVSASAPNGRYFVRVLAVNGAGTQASPEVSVSIGPPPQSGLRCVAFGPYVGAYSPLTGHHPPAAVIDALVNRVSIETDFNCLMTFGVLHGLDYTFEAAKRRGLRVIAIVWLEGTDAARRDDDASIELGITRAKEYPDTIVRIACGSEVRVRQGATVAERTIRHCVDRFRAAGVSQPIGTNDTWWSLCDESWPCRAAPVSRLDWIGANIYAWWENRFSGLFPCVAASEAASFTLARLQDVRAAHPGKEIILTEFGWPSGPNGYRETNQRTRQPGCGVASRANQQLVIAQLSAVLRQHEVPHAVFEAFSEPWKTDESVGPWWGILTDGASTRSQQH